jgi:hypothetical protein
MPNPGSQRPSISPSATFSSQPIDPPALAREDVHLIKRRIALFRVRQVIAAHLRHLPHDTYLVGPEETLVLPWRVRLGLKYEVIGQLREEIPAVKALVPAAHPTAVRLVAIVAPSDVHGEHALERIARCGV